MDIDGIPAPDGWRDQITGLDGPDFWQRVLAAEVAGALRYQRPLTVVLVELDGMSDLVRLSGADIAQLAVVEAARTLRRGSRSSDHCARLGAARFALLLTETDEIAAINFVERLRETGAVLSEHVGEHLALRFGWASPKLGESAESLMLRAERRLQQELEEVRAQPQA